MLSRPTGTITFLFTDIEGSTRHWEEHRAWMEHAFARQEQIIREAAAAHRGYVYKMIGDAFQIAFATAGEAVATALDAQRALQAEAWGDCGPLRVRMALHTGVTEERGDDYVGPALHRVARLVSVGHGGQILLSQASYDLVCDALPPRLSIRDLGEYRLKDLDRSEHIYQLATPDLVSLFPPLRTVTACPNNLPVQLTTFIGREKELAQSRSLLQNSRLLTLTGVGGTGKTRLGLQLAASVLDEFPDGAWCVELAPLASGALVPQAVAGALNVREQQGQSILDRVFDYMREKQLLLVLDNCEHLIEACAGFADSLLRAVPGVKVLATSREALGIAGEQIYPVPPLGFSAAGYDLEKEVAIPSEAIRLFVERARAVQPQFELTAANISSIAEICRRLDGIPLAIELAAARLRGLSVGEIAKRLDDRFHLLTGGNRTALPRQQTLRSLIDWSYNLLTAQESTLIRRVSVFAGGWTLDAAEEVCSDEGLVRADIVDHLTRLVDKSLVKLDDANATIPRYYMLETIRQYALDKLLDSGESERVRDRHLDYWLGWAEAADQALKGREQVAWLARIERERENLRAALEWSQRPTFDPEISLRLTAALGWFWWLHGHYDDAKQWTERGIARGGETTRALAYALSWWGVVATGLPGQLENARARLEESVTLSRRLGDPALLSWTLAVLGRVAEHQGETAEAIAFAEEAVQVSRMGAGPWYTSFALERLGEGYRLAGNFERAAALYEESLELARSYEDYRNIAVLLHNIGYVLLERGDLQAAVQCFTESLTIGKEMGDERRVVMCLAGLAATIVKKGQLEKAALLYGAADQLRQAIGAPWGAADLAACERHMTPIGGSEFEAARIQGRTMTMDQTTEYALKDANA